MNKIKLHSEGRAVSVLFYSPAILPVSCGKPAQVLKVSDFGAVPNDGKDDIPAILAALENGSGKKNVTLAFEMGLCDGMDSLKDEALLLYNTGNVMIAFNKLINSAEGLKIRKGCDMETISKENNTVC